MNPMNRLLPHRSTSGLLSVIIPARNESQNIVKVLQAIDDNLKDRDNAEVVIVDAQSTDNTFAIVEALIPKLKTHMR